MKSPAMKNTLVRFTLAAFVASTSVAWAQHAVPRGGGGGSSSGSSGGGSDSGATSSGSSGGSTSSGSSGGDSGYRAVPRYPTTSSSGGGSGRSGGGRSGGDGVASARGGRGGSGGYVDRSPDGAPVTSRPQGNRPVTGYAVPRGTVAAPPGRPGGDYYYYPGAYNWYYNPWGFGSWGLGYIWDPFWFGPGSGAFGYGGGYPYGGGGYGYSGGYAGGYSGGYAGDYRRDDDGHGALRIKVKPRDAKVMVDGFFSGTVDDFDGKFQKMSLVSGTHKIKLEAEGFEPLVFDVLIVDGQTVNYKGELRKR
jgi:hypothetical protein